MTPPKGPFLLSGITRDLILEVMASAQLPYQETAISAAQLRVAEEIWITSSTREILPVIMLDDKPVSDGKPGPLWSHVWQLFQTYKQTIRAES
jgi:D-alanine transaminase